MPVDDPAQTATAIARALDRGPAERAALATQGVVLVEEMADQDRNLARVEKLYRGLAAKRSGYGSRGGDGAATR